MFGEGQMSASLNRWRDEPGRAADLGLLSAWGARAIRGTGCLLFCASVNVVNIKRGSALLPRWKGEVTLDRLALQVPSASAGRRQSVTAAGACQIIVEVCQTFNFIIVFSLFFPIICL